MSAKRPPPPVRHGQRHRPPIFPCASAIAIALACLLSSCSQKDPAHEPPATYAPDWLGTIRMVNSQEHFALIETTAPVPPGASIRSMRDLETTATLRATPLKNHPFLIADIITGTPAPQDRIALSSPPVEGNAGSSSNTPQDR